MSTQCTLMSVSNKEQTLFIEAVLSSSTFVTVTAPTTTTPTITTITTITTFRLHSVLTVLFSGNKSVLGRVPKWESLRMLEQLGGYPSYRLEHWMSLRICTTPRGGQRMSVSERMKIDGLFFICRIQRFTLRRRAFACENKIHLLLAASELILKWGTGEAKPEAGGQERGVGVGWDFWWGGTGAASSPPHKLGLAERGKLPQRGAGRRPGRRRVILHYVPPDYLAPCVDLLVYNCNYACDWGTHTWLVPHHCELRVHDPCVSRFRRLWSH